MASSRSTSNRRSINVFVVHIGDEPIVVEMPVGSTVKDCLQRANVAVSEAKTNQIRLDAKNTTLATRVRQDQIISIVGNVEGNGGARR